MKHSNFIGGLCLMVPLLLASVDVRAQELTLFGVGLRDAPQERLDEAIRHAGGRVTEQSPGKTVYDAGQIGLPGAATLKTIYFGQRFVMAQYSITARGPEDEKLRKMLVAKYGQPQSDANSFPRTSRVFDGEYVTDGKYRWNFAGGLKLIYSKPFSGDAHLTYLDPKNEVALERMLNEQADKEAKDTAKSQSDAF